MAHLLDGHPGGGAAADLLQNVVQGGVGSASPCRVVAAPPWCRAHRRRAAPRWPTRFQTAAAPGASAQGQCGDEPRRLPDPSRLLEGERELDERRLTEAAPDEGDVDRQPGREARGDADER